MNGQLPFGIPIDHHACVARQMLMTRSSVNSKLLLTQESHGRGRPATDHTNAPECTPSANSPHLGSSIVYNDPVWVLHGLFDHLSCAQAYRETYQCPQATSRFFSDYCFEKIGIRGDNVRPSPHFICRREFGGDMDDATYIGWRSHCVPTRDNNNGDFPKSPYPVTRCVTSYECFSLTSPARLYAVCRGGKGPVDCSSNNAVIADESLIMCAWCRIPFMGPPICTASHYGMLASFDRLICAQTFCRITAAGTIGVNSSVPLSRIPNAPPPWVQRVYNGPMHTAQFKQLLDEIEAGCIRFRMWPGIHTPVCVSITASMDAYESPDCFVMLPDGSAETAKRKAAAASAAAAAAAVPSSDIVMPAPESVEPAAFDCEEDGASDHEEMLVCE